MKPKSKTKIGRWNVSFSAEVHDKVVRQAKAANRSVSNYLATLILEKEKAQ